MANLASLTGPKFKSFNSILVSTTAVEVKASAGDVYGWIISNPHTADVWVKLYDKAAAGVDPATDVPVLRILVPALGQVVLEPVAHIEVFQTAISVRASTGAVDTDTTAAATLPKIKIKYY